MRIKNRVKFLLCLLLVVAMLPLTQMRINADALNEKDLKFTDLKKYALVGEFNEGFAIIYNRSGENVTHVDSEGKEVKEERIKFGYINTAGEEVLIPEFGFATRFLNGRATALDYSHNNMTYLFDTKFNKVGGKAHNFTIYPFYDDISVAFINPQNRVFINKDGVYMKDIDSKWNDIFALTAFSEDLAFAKKKGKDGKFGIPEIIDKKGNTVGKLSRGYYSFGIFKNGLAAVSVPKKNSQKNELLWGVIDKSGKEVIPCQYDSIADNDYYHKTDKLGYIQVEKDGKWKLIDKTGKQVFPGYDAYGYRRFEEGLCSVLKDGKWGFIDLSGKEVVPPRYDVVWPFSEGLAAFKLGNKYGYLDKDGNVVIEPIFNDASDFYKDYATVRIGREWKILMHPRTYSAPSNNAKREKIAKFSGLELTIDDKKIQGLPLYSIEGNHYIKLRDFAYILKETGKKFAVEWNIDKKLISLVSQKDYKAVGGELKDVDAKDKSAVFSNFKMELDGKELNLAGYMIQENSYFKLDDLCDALGIALSGNTVGKTLLLKTK